MAQLMAQFLKCAHTCYLNVIRLSHVKEMYIFDAFILEMSCKIKLSIDGMNVIFLDTASSLAMCRGVSKIVFTIVAFITCASKVVLSF